MALSPQQIGVLLIANLGCVVLILLLVMYVDGEASGRHKELMQLLTTKVETKPSDVITVEATVEEETDHVQVVEETEQEISAITVETLDAMITEALRQQRGQHG